MDEQQKIRIAQQQDEQYLAIGKFVVNYEHLLDAIKFKLRIICGFGEEIKILIEAFPASQSIEVLGNLVEWKTKDWDDDDQSKKLFKYLIQDLKTLNSKRNSFVHSVWFIDWVDENTTDVSEITGKKFLTEKKKSWKKLTAGEIDDAIDDCKMFYQIMYTSWPVDLLGSPNEVPPFHEFYSRTNSGKWISLRSE